MAVLTSGDRIEIWSQLQSDLSSVREALSLSKAELQAAIDATDNWIDGNAGSYNNALPAAAQSGLTTKQKAMLFLYVASKRYGVF